MSSDASISTVITTYNYAEFLPDAIESVLTQTRPVDDIVVVDDGSTDNTAQVVAAYANRGVRYVRQNNQGAGAARNRGIFETSGDFIAFLDADDMWLPDKTRLQEAWLQAHPTCVLVSGQKVWWDVARDRTSIERFGDLSPARLRREILVLNVVGNPSMTLVRRSAIVQGGEFDSSLRWGQDWEFFIRMSRIGEIGFLPHPVVKYRWHQSSLSHDRRWERLDVVHGISRRAIARHEVGWERAVLRLRARSAIEFDRARLSLRLGKPRWQRIAHALLSLIIYPFERAPAKSMLVARSLIGETTYRFIRRRIRHRTGG
jgi:glycosyltransferase involved in cell wall biosynthesis